LNSYSVIISEFSLNYSFVHLIICACFYNETKSRRNKYKRKLAIRVLLIYMSISSQGRQRHYNMRLRQNKKKEKKTWWTFRTANTSPFSSS